MYRSILLQGWDLPEPGKIPNDKNTLMRLADCPDEETWNKYSESILSMFDLTRDGKFYTNKRQQEELRKVKAKYASYAERGRRGGKSKKPKEIQASKAEAELKPSLSLAKKDGSNQNQNQNHIQNHNQSESQSDETLASELPPSALAVKVIQETGIAANQQMVVAVSGAVEFCVKHEGKSKNAAVEFLIAHCKDEIDRGGMPNKFWFDDRKWRNVGLPPPRETQAKAMLKRVFNEAE